MDKYGNNVTFFHVDRMRRQLHSAPSSHCLSAACVISVKKGNPQRQDSPELQGIKARHSQTYTKQETRVQQGIGQSEAKRDVGGVWDWDI